MDKPKFYQPRVLKHLQELEMNIVRDIAKICSDENLLWFGFCGTGIGAVRHKGFIPWDDDIDLSMPRADHDRLMQILEEQYSDKYYILNTATDANYPLANTRVCLKGTVFREESLKDIDCPWGIFVDVYPLDNAADNPLAYYYQMWSSWFWGKMLILRSVPRPYLYIHGLPAKIVAGGCLAGNKLMDLLHIDKARLLKNRDRQLKKYNHMKTRRVAYFCDPLPYTNTFTNEDIYPLQMLDFEDIQLPFPKNLDELLTKMFGDYMTPPPVEKRKTHYPYELDFGPYKIPTEPKKKPGRNDPDSRKTPMVSICIPAYNSARYIRKTVEAALTQTYPNLEVLVVDDCSVDETVACLRDITDPRFRLIVNEENLGMTGNWNKCVENCRGEYIKLIPSDDLLYPDSVKKSVRYLKKHEDVKLVITGIDLIDNDDKKIGSYAGWPFAGVFDGKMLAKFSIMLNNFFGNPVGAMFRKSDFQRTGGFDERIPYILDFDLWLSLAGMGNVAVIPEHLCGFRVRSDSNTGVMTGKRGADYTAEHARLIDKHSERGDVRINLPEKRLSVAWRRLRNYLIACYIRIKS